MSEAEWNQWIGEQVRGALADMQEMVTEVPLPGAKMVQEHFVDDTNAWLSRQPEVPHTGGGYHDDNEFWNWMHQMPQPHFPPLAEIERYSDLEQAGLLDDPDWPHKLSGN